MCIERLPETTVRLIGANQVLTDPASVVKELIENALDAQATSIIIELSSNTIDSIQVRDNGRGVPAEDRLSLARRHYTSKMPNDADLAAAGRMHLGFRGEALASLAELSGTLIISTRVEGEPVAACITFHTNGDIASTSHISLPIGTTVKIQDFNKSHPVRQRLAIKGADSCIRRIQSLLQAYALARPSTRFSMKFTKGKSSRSNWVYAPGGNDELRDVAAKLFGVKCASECISATTRHGQYSLESFLPREEADPTRINDLGAFISVDGRPISSDHGTGWAVAKTFRDALAQNLRSPQSLKRPFAIIKITTDNACYDANIEPSKHDVLFDDLNSLLEAVRQACTDLYLRPPWETGHATTDTAQSVSNTQSNDTAVKSDDRETPVIQHRSNMYGCEEEDIEAMADVQYSIQDDAELHELKQASKDVQLFNPWVAAKLNATARPRDHPKISVPHVSDTTIDEEMILASEGTDLPPFPTSQSFSQAIQQLPTPRPSSPVMFHSSLSMPSDLTGQISEPHQVTRPLLLDVPPSSEQILTPDPATMPSSADQPRRSSRIPTSVMQSSQADEAGIPLNAIPSIRSKTITRGRSDNPTRNRPFKLPSSVNRPEQMWFDHLETPREEKRSWPRPSQIQRRVQSLAHRDSSSECASRGVFIQSLIEPHRETPLFTAHDTRKQPPQIKELTQEDITSVPIPRALVSGSLPDIVAADMAVDTSMLDIPPVQALDQTAVPGSVVAQAHLRRRSNRLRRSSTQLPLERVAADCHTHNLTVKITLVIGHVPLLCDTVDITQGWSDFNTTADLSDFRDMRSHLDDLHEIAQRLNTLLTPPGEVVEPSRALHLQKRLAEAVKSSALSALT